MREKSKLHIRYDLLLENFQRMSRFAAQANTLFMVKANAYGHGLLPTADIVSKECEVDILGVASLGEAKVVRKELPELKKDIFVFSDTQLWDETSLSEYIDFSIIPVIYDIDDLKIFIADSRFKNLPLVLKFDTGLNRLGIKIDQLEELVSLLARFDRKNIHHVMTHFSSSFLATRPGDRTERQYNMFKKILRELEQAGFTVEQTSCSNSGAIEQGIGVEQTHIRPGLMLYGPKSCAKSDWDGASISSLETFVLKSEFVKKGTPIGYGASPLHADGQLLYLPLGYGDGMSTYYSGKKIQIEGVPASFVGRMNMDISILFIENTDKLVFTKGRVLKLWDHDQVGLSDFAAALKTHPYQILTGLSQRVPHSYPLR